MTPIIEKIRKLLALSKSSNANEAAAAAAAAQRLMAEHQIAEAELEVGDGPRESACKSADPIDAFGEQAPTWKGVLCQGLADLLGCEVWLEWVKKPGGGLGRLMQVVGRPSDVASLRYLYAWLVSEIERLTQKHAKGKGRTYANSYRLGAVHGCLDAMQTANREVRAKASGEALVRVDERAAESEAVIAALGLNLRTTSRRSRSNAEAYERGQRAGRGLHTGAALGASSGARLLGA